MTYAQLQSDIISTLNRQDLAGVSVQRFIRLCEKELARKLEGVKRQKRVQLYTLSGKIALPTDFERLELSLIHI